MSLPPATGPFSRISKRILSRVLLRPKKNLTTPFSMIPNEILSRILLASLNHPKPLDRDGRLWFSILRSVCRRWRDVAFGTPEAWRCLQVTPQDIETQMDSIEGWFGRGGDVSGPYSLVSLYSVGMTAYLSTTATARLRTLLARYTWEELALAVLGFSLLASDIGPFSSLKRVTLIHESTEQTTHDIFPALEQLHWISIHIPDKLLLRHWQSLSTLHLEFCQLNAGGPGVFESFLSDSNLPCMEELILGRCWLQARSSISSPPPPTSMRTNHALIRFVVGCDVISALDSITFPALQFLRILGPVLIHNSEQIEGFISRFTPSLRSLSVEDAGRATTTFMIQAALQAPLLNTISSHALYSLPKLDLSRMDGVTPVCVTVMTRPTKAEFARWWNIEIANGNRGSPLVVVIPRRESRDEMDLDKGTVGRLRRAGIEFVTRDYGGHMKIAHPLTSWSYNR